MTTIKRNWCGRTLGLLVALTLVLAACGSDNGSDTAEPELSDTSSDTSEPEVSDTSEPEESTEEPEESTELRTITMGIASRSAFYLPELVAIDQGYFADEGLELSLEIGAPPSLAAAAITGEIPYNNAIPSALQSVVSGATPLRGYFFTFGVPMFDLYVQKDIETFDQLSGGTVSVTAPNSADQYVASNLMAARGEDVGTLTFVGGGATANRWGALQSGAVDGAMLSPPFAQLAEEAGFVLLASGQELSPVAGAGIFMDPDYAADHTSDLKGSIRALLRAMDFIRENPDDTIALLERELEIDPSVSAAAYDVMVTSMTTDGKIAVADLDQQIEDIKRVTSADSEITGTQVIDYQLLDEVLEESLSSNG